MFETILFVFFKKKCITLNSNSISNRFQVCFTINFTNYFFVVVWWDSLFELKILLEKSIINTRTKFRRNRMFELRLVVLYSSVDEVDGLGTEEEMKERHRLVKIIKPCASPN